MITKDTFRNQYTGLSTDNWTEEKIVSKLENGDVRFEMDTGDAYMWNESAQEWVLL